MRILIMGRPGAGKGTQSARLSQVLGIPHLNVGALLRAAITTGNAFGPRARECVASGSLVPDELVSQLVDERMSRADVRHRGFILDGCPRTHCQLDTLLDQLGPAGIDVSIELYIPTEVALARLECRGRGDDAPSVLRHRLDDYTRETAPMIATLAGAGRLMTIDANRPVGDVTAELLRLFHPPRYTNECRHDSNARRSPCESTDHRKVSAAP